MVSAALCCEVDAAIAENKTLLGVPWHQFRLLRHQRIRLDRHALSIQNHSGQTNSRQHIGRTFGIL